MSVTKKTETTYTLTCKCGKTVKVEEIKSAKVYGWHYSSNQYPVTENTIKDVECPECHTKKMKKWYNSDDLREKIQGKFYDKNPKKWSDDVLEYLGIPKDHPKAGKLLSLGWEYGHSNGYNEVLCHLEDLVDLIN